MEKIKVEAKVENKESDVAAIRRVYSDIISKYERSALDSSSFSYSCRGEKSGTVSYFSTAGKLTMIIHRYAEYDHYTAEDRYFLNGDALVFVYRHRISWSFESGPEGSTKDNVTEQRSYFVNQVPIKCLEKKYVIHSRDKEKPNPDEVSNTVTDCNNAIRALQFYRKLASYQQGNYPKCIE